MEVILTRWNHDTQAIKKNQTFFNIILQLFFPIFLGTWNFFYLILYQKLILCGILCYDSFNLKTKGFIL